jgi:hypothetical protein
MYFIRLILTDNIMADLQVDPQVAADLQDVHTPVVWHVRTSDPDSLYYY